MIGYYIAFTKLLVLFIGIIHLNIWLNIILFACIIPWFIDIISIILFWSNILNILTGNVYGKCDCIVSIVGFIWKHVSSSIIAYT